MIFLYNIFIITGIAIGLPVIIPLVLITGKRRKTFLARLGLKPFPKPVSRKKYHNPDNRPIWVHALSVGEVISAVPLVKKLKKHCKQNNIVFSASTETGFQTANNLLKKNADSIFFFPYDLSVSVKHIASKVNPAVVIIVESDIWPNFMSEMKKRNIPVLLVNARLSGRSYRGYKKISPFSKKLFLSFSKICAQSQKDAGKFRGIGVPSSMIKITGNIKFDQESDPVSQEQADNLKQSLGINSSQKIFLAGSTHDKEESIILDAFLRLKESNPDIILIIVPRNPDRSRSVCSLCKFKGISAVTMTDLEEKKLKSDVIVINRMGILKTLYAIADMAFVGGSLVKCGGHNPLEPAAFSRPIIFGPDMSDFSDISKMLVESGGAVTVYDPESIYQTLLNLITNEEKARDMGKKAFDVFNKNKGAVDKTLNVVKQLIKS